MLEFPDIIITDKFIPVFKELLQNSFTMKAVEVVAKGMDSRFIASIVGSYGYIKYIQFGVYAANSKDTISHQLVLNRSIDSEYVVKGELMINHDEWLPIMDGLSACRVSRGDFRITLAENLTRIAKKYEDEWNVDLNIIIAGEYNPEDGYENSDKQANEVARWSEFVDKFFQIKCVEWINASLLFPDNSRIELQDRFGSCWTRVTLKSPMAMKAMKSLPQSIDSDKGVECLKHNVVIDFGSKHSDRTEIPTIDLSTMNSKEAIETIQLMDVNSIEQLSVESISNKRISAVVNDKLNFPKASLDALWRSKTGLLLLSGINKRPFDLIDGIYEAADATRCFQAIGQVQPTGVEAICLIIDRSKCPMYDIV